MYTVNATPETLRIPLGRRGENLARRVVFDLSAWETEFGEGTVTLLHRRAGDPAPAPAEIEQDGSAAVWTLTESDTYYTGRGTAELQWKSGETVVKSAPILTEVEGSADPAEEEPPAPYEGWVSRVLNAEERAVAAAEEAKQTAENALPLAGGTVTGDLTVLGTLTAQTEDTWQSAACTPQSLTAGTPAAAAALTLGAGVWLISWEVRFSANTSGYRTCCLSASPVTTAAACIANGTTPGVSGVPAVLCSSRLVRLTEEKTLTLYAVHSSTAALRLTSGSLCAVRVGAV